MARVRRAIHLPVGTREREDGAAARANRGTTAGTGAVNPSRASPLLPRLRRKPCGGGPDKL